MVSLLDYILKRVLQQNRNFICIVVGSPGSGKSYACLTFAEMLMKRQDKLFKIENVCFGAKEFMDRTATGKVKKGNVVIFEEGGVGMDSRNFYTATNKTLAYVFEVFRTDNIVLFINVPDISFIDKKIRVLAHAIIEMKKINYNKKISYGTIKFIETSGNSKKQYNKHLRSVKTKTMKITNWRFPKPGENIIKEYEDKRKKYTDEIKLDAIAAITDTEKEKKRTRDRTLTIKDYINLLITKNGSIINVKNRYTHIYGGTKRIHGNKICIDLEIGERKAKLISQVLEGKFGYARL